jgi:type IV pilus biogenesis protein CpaD/CtpE
VPAFSRWILLSCAAASAVALSGCANVSGSSGNNAPAAVSSLPPSLAQEVKTDVGEYLVKPRAGTPQKDIQATIDRLRGMPGVQSAELTAEGKIDVQFSGGSTPAQHEAAVKQLAALGDVEQGI